MFVFRKTMDLRLHLDAEKETDAVIGYVPTMGALHEGHLSLVRLAMEECSLCVVSIFVNPTQFNEASDLDRYPRPTEDDILKLKSMGCHVVFLPDVQEVYPDNYVAPVFEFEGLDTVLEGEFRPGHFKGVAEVMYRLLHIVQPDRLYMGQKDYQQTCIVAKLIEQQGMPADLIVVPTQREEDGLAMSSRNRLLKPEHRECANVINQALKRTWRDRLTKSGAELSAQATDMISSVGFRPEYFAIVDQSTLQPVDQIKENDRAVACCAAWAGEVRLIDNMLLD